MIREFYKLHTWDRRRTRDTEPHDVKEQSADSGHHWTAFRGIILYKHFSFQNLYKFPRNSHLLCWLSLYSTCLPPAHATCLGCDSFREHNLLVRVCLAEGIALIFKENNRDFAVRRTFKEAFIGEALVENLVSIQAHRSLKLCSHDIECKSSQIDWERLKSFSINFINMFFKI